MNAYSVGMFVSMVCYLTISAFVSRKIKDANDFYVAGKNAPTYLIAGSMIASLLGTGLFMADAAMCYEGNFSSVIIMIGILVSAYIVGAVFFGRYLRRSNVLTIPEFFEKRFCSSALKNLASVIAVITTAAYLLSILQGIGTLMSAVTGVNYNVCIIISLSVFTTITIASGSQGVLITDTLMALVFTGALVVSVFFITYKFGGWYHAVGLIASNPLSSDIISWGGKLGSLYDTGVQNLGWGIVYGLVWMSVGMVSPWQASRYLMAKNEHTVIRSAPISAFFIFILEFLAGMAAVMVNIANPYLKDSSYVMIWASMNLLPKVLGVVLLTGILAAGISSATTYLSLIGSTIANDMIQHGSRGSVRIGRLSMAAVSGIVLMLAIANPPSIRWFMHLGGSIIACAWMPVAIASIFSRRVTKAGAYYGMLVGFLSCFCLKIFINIKNIELPVYLEPSLIGMLCNMIVLIVVSSLSNVTEEEKRAREYLLRIPETELASCEVSKTLRWVRGSIVVGVVIMFVLLIFWVLPYLHYKYMA